MLFKMLRAFGLIGALVAAAAGSVWAAVPLAQVRDWQKAAPEAVNLTALSIDQTSASRPYGDGGTVTTTNLTLTARVDVVPHS
jgi:hypothetical protein